MSPPIKIKSGNIYVIGNAPEERNISDNILKNDTIIRFNKPNSSCSLKADILFVANGQQRVMRLEDTKTPLINKDYQVFWRYQPYQMLLSKYEPISISRRLRFAILFQLYKRKNYPSKQNETYVKFSTYTDCTRWLQGNKPSSGILLIYCLLALYPQRKIFLHNFTFKGTDAHNWKLEEQLIKKLISEQKIFLI